MVKRGNEKEIRENKGLEKGNSGWKWWKRGKWVIVVIKSGKVIQIATKNGITWNSNTAIFYWEGAGVLSVVPSVGVLGSLAGAVGVCSGVAGVSGTFIVPLEIISSWPL